HTTKQVAKSKTNWRSGASCSGDWCKLQWRLVQAAVATGASCSGDWCKYWYQKKETEIFRLILSFDESDGKIRKHYGHPQKDDFTPEKSQSGSELKINKVKVDHSASYYCSCDKRAEQKPADEQMLVFVTEREQETTGSSSLLCLASAMFPPVVQFSWKRQKNNGPLEDLTSEEQLDLRESGYSTSILLVHQQEDSSYKYICSVKHEGGNGPIYKSNDANFCQLSSQL
uniref:Ig-like domain-containing protein n=1 Tax=Oryzias latipes TaxID=8090 RepID=A0A3P9JJY6_ORYLA